MGDDKNGNGVPSVKRKKEKKSKGKLMGKRSHDRKKS